MKMAVVTIGYRHWAMSMSDATKLLSIAQRAFLVEQEHYTGPFARVDNPEDENFAVRMEIADVGSKKSKSRIPKSHRITYESVKESAK